MYDYRAELAEINARCDALGITGELLSKTDVLGYTNPRKALIDHVDDEDKGVTKCYTHGGD